MERERLTERVSKEMDAYEESLSNLFTDTVHSVVRKKYFEEQYRHFDKLITYAQNFVSGNRRDPSSFLADVVKLLDGALFIDLPATSYPHLTPLKFHRSLTTITEFESDANALAAMIRSWESVQKTKSSSYNVNERSDKDLLYSYVTDIPMVMERDRKYTTNTNITKRIAALVQSSNDKVEKLTREQNNTTDPDTLDVIRRELLVIKIVVMAITTTSYNYVSLATAIMLKLAKASRTLLVNRQ